jgi:hypothetical protein
LCELQRFADDGWLHHQRATGELPHLCHFTSFCKV